MGRQAKLKKQRKIRKAAAQNSSQPPLPPAPKGDIERLNNLGYGEHNRLRSPDVPFDRPEPQL